MKSFITFINYKAIRVYLHYKSYFTGSQTDDQTNRIDKHILINVGQIEETFIKFELYVLFYCSIFKLMNGKEMLISIEFDFVFVELRTGIIAFFTKKIKILLQIKILNSFFFM